jgi:hypothetical protein
MSSSSTGKRYCDLPGVQITPKAIPAPLLPLLEMAKEWAIVGDDALERAVRKAGKEKIRSVVKLATPLKSEIDRFAHESAGAKATPVPDEVVVFQMFGWSLKLLEFEAR